MQKKRVIFLALIIFIGFVSPVMADSQARVTVFGVDTTGFPHISAWVAAWDSQGQFIRGIRADDVTVKEDGAPCGIITWEAQQPGAQVVIAVEPGRALGVRDALGVSRYEYIYNQIHSWAEHASSELYDVSLYASDGLLGAHLADMPVFLQMLEGYAPQHTEKKVGLKALAEGLQLAVDPTPRPGMGRALLWITPLPSQDALAQLEQYRSLAQQSRVRVYIWLVGTPDLADTPQVQTLRQFAEATSGRLVIFSGEETLPVLDDLFEPLTHVYRLTYATRAFHGKEHTLEVSLHTPQGDLQAEAVTFPLALQPPAPVILDPPEQIVRGLPPGETDAALRRPTQQTVRVGITFPDEHPRSLARLTLLVDGQPATVQTEPPFDTLVWDLTPYDRSGVHTLQVEAEDAYGLVGRSQPVTVQITVPKPETGLTATLGTHRTALTIGIVALAGAVLLAVLFVGGRRRPRRDGAVPTAAAASQESEVSLPRRWLAWRGKRRAQDETAPRAALAYLVPLAEDVANGRTTAEPLALLTAEATLGSDPAQVDLVIADPSVEPLHARMWRTDEGAFFIADQRSTAGTWLNYAPVSPEGARVQDGDLIHLGKAGFRFRLELQEAARVTVKPLQGS